MRPQQSSGLGSSGTPKRALTRTSKGLRRRPEKIREMLKAKSIIDPTASVAVKSLTAPSVEGVRHAGLEITAQRIVAAFDLEKRGITSEMLVGRVRQFE